jgi:hypothetical protein
MITKERRLKRNVVQTVIVHAVKQNVKAASIRVMARNSTMLVSIGRVDSVLLRQELSAVMQIVFANLHVLK